MCDLSDPELASYIRMASVWGTGRGYCGQYNFWLNFRYGVALNKTEDAAGHMVATVRERESERVRVGFESLTADSKRISALVICTRLLLTKR
jgi:hypothetical protein